MYVREERGLCLPSRDDRPHGVGFESLDKLLDLTTFAIASWKATHVYNDFRDPHDVGVVRRVLLASFANVALVLWC